MDDADERDKLFAPNPEGSLEFGFLPSDAARTIRRQAGPIRLLQEDLRHIEDRHGRQIHAAGFQEITAFAKHVCDNYNTIYPGNRGGALLAIVLMAGEQKKGMVLKLEPAMDAGGDYYAIKTAMPIRDSYLKNRTPLLQRDGPIAKPPFRVAPFGPGPEADTKSINPHNHHVNKEIIMATAPEDVLKASKTTETQEQNAPEEGMDEVGMEARKALLDAFRQERDAALAEHRKTLDALGKRHVEARKNFSEELLHAQQQWMEQNKELSPRHRQSGWALEQAKAQEKMAKDQEAQVQSVNASAAIPTWEEYLQGKAKGGDVIAKALLEEMDADTAKGQGPGLEGHADIAPRPMVLEGLTAKADNDGKAVHYHRDDREVFTDQGKRIEVLDTRDQEIEAALRLAAAKFKPGTPLKLTGNDEFKDRAAQIAGQLGIPIRNRELQEAWARGREAAQAARTLAVDDPDIAPRNRIFGEDREAPAPSQEMAPEVPSPTVPEEGKESTLPTFLPDPVRIKTTETARQAAEAAGLPVDGEEVLLPLDRYMAARADLAHADVETRMELLRSSITDGFGQLPAEGRARLMAAGLADEQGRVTAKGIDLILVQDQLIAEARERAPEDLRPELTPSQERAEQQTQEREAEEQALRTRNIDERMEQQAQTAGRDHDGLAESTELAHEAETAEELAASLHGLPTEPDWGADIDSGMAR